MRALLVILLTLLVPLVPQAAAEDAGAGTGRMTIMHKDGLGWHSCKSAAAFTIVMDDQYGELIFVASPLTNACSPVLGVFPAGSCYYDSTYTTYSCYHGYESFTMRGRIVQYHYYTHDEYGTDARVELVEGNLAVIQPVGY